MNQVPVSLKKEPLIEVVWQVQFEPKEGLSVGDLLPGLLYSELKESHPKLQLHRLHTADIPAHISQVDPNLRFSAKYRIEEDDSPFLFQVGERIITLNCRKPYTGWASFKNMLLKLIDIIEKSDLVPTPIQHSLRHINLLTLNPAPNLDALQVNLSIGDLHLENLPLQLRVELPDGDCNHIVQIATPATANLSSGKSQGSILDIETLPNALPTSWKDISIQIEMLHEYAIKIFYEHLLTDKAVELMEPEY